MMLPSSDKPLTPLWRAVLADPIVWLFALCAVLFIRYPSIDLIVSHYFYQPDLGFYLNDHPWVQGLYRALGGIGLPLGIVLLLLCGLGYGYGQRRPRHVMLRALVNSRRHWLFALGVLLCATLVIEGVFKQHWHRARPHQITEFGGQATFTPAFIRTDQCATNCSFVSGHAAIGFYPMLLAWVRRKKRWLLLGLIPGSVLSYVRVVQGGHFLSDVVCAGFIVYCLCQWISHVYYRFHLSWLPARPVCTETSH